MLAGVVVLIAAVVGIVLIAQTFSGSNNAPTTQASSSDETSSSDTTGVKNVGTPSDNGSDPSAGRIYSNGKFPDVSKERMIADITDLIRRFHQYAKDGDTAAAWALLSARKRRQVEGNFYGAPQAGDPDGVGGFAEWADQQVELGSFVDPSGVQVSLGEPNFKDEGVMTIVVSNMPYSNSGKPYCTNWHGYTWVRYEGGRWKYEPGFAVTSERYAAFKPIEKKTLGYGDDCRS